ncbi:MAG TPA: putative lipid II flippase FtsW [Trebonia sp.]|jgi:cell division protein FtsW|nr:putative lipid II flippase FtsW [Trebonia sp.]
MHARALTGSDLADAKAGPGALAPGSPPPVAAPGGPAGGGTAGGGAGGGSAAPGGAAAGGPALAGSLAGVRGRARALRELLDRPLTPYYLILGITALLLLLGLVMVLSTGSIRDLTAGYSPYSDFIKQLVGVLVAIPVTWVVARSSPRVFRAAGYPLLAVSIIGLALTFIPAVSPPVNGASRWIMIGPVQFQPSELAKLALVVWGADLLARKEKLGLLRDWRHMLVPLMPGAGLLAMLVIAGDDLGTTIILVIILLALLWVAGAPGRVFTLMLILMGLVLVLLMVTSPYRAERLTSFLNPRSDLGGVNYQGNNGLVALGSGGFFGVGLGASGAKWGYVPEDWSDYIFAIIGEELGLVGTLCVTALYGALAYAGLRVARRAEDTFSRLAAAAITIWVAMQAIVNMGAVIGVLPITGIPLPLVSEGLSSVLVTMVALGVLMSFARRAPGAREALAARGPSLGEHALSWLGRGRHR